MKFIRRPNLTLSTRINIAAEAMLNMGNYGFMTNLALSYNVSRPFIYSLVHKAKDTLSFQFDSVNPSSKPVLEQQVLDKKIFLHRLEGISSIERISNMRKYENIYPASIGYISKRLTDYGKQLPNTLKSESPVQCYWLNDELFDSSRPIILTVEPISLSMLRIELAKKRDHITWNNHFKKLQDNNFYPLGLGYSMHTSL